MSRSRASLALLALMLSSSLSFAGCCCDPDKKCIKDPPCKPCEQPSCDGYAPAPAK